MIRILWFTNVLLPDAAARLGRPLARTTGWWMSTLLGRLKQQGDMRLAVVTCSGLRDEEFSVDGVDYFVVGRPIQELIALGLGLPFTFQPSRCKLAQYAEIVRDWRPDVIHVHGTERDYGLIKARGLIQRPLVVSIQGLMAPCARKAYGELMPFELHGRLRRFLPVKLHCRNRLQWFRSQIPIEEEILTSADIVLGRSDWDRAWAWALNPDVDYRHVDELMRPAFLAAAAWNIDNIRRHRIFCTSGSQPLKGLHLLVQAISWLRETYPNITLAVASEGFVPRPSNDYARFIVGQLRKRGLEKAVTFLGTLDAVGIIEQLRCAHCFVTPSFLENGCNALQEAMLVGTPCVATLTGGLLTTVEAGKTALTFPVGDAAMLARQIHRIFSDDALAVQLSTPARSVAQRRHDPEAVESAIRKVYEELAARRVRHTE